MCFDVTKISISENYREILSKEIDASFLRLSNAINRFNDPEALKPINRKDLNSFPLMSWVEINSKVRVRKRKNRFGTYLNFDTEILEGGELGEHFHLVFFCVHHRLLDKNT